MKVIVQFCMSTSSCITQTVQYSCLAARLKTAMQKICRWEKKGQKEKESGEAE